MSKTPNRPLGPRRPKVKKAAEAHRKSKKVRERIVELRKERGLTATQMAKRMGLSRPFYSQLEVGTRRMDLVYLLMICSILKVEPGKLLK